MFTILIAEDNKNTARLMEVVLTQNGYQTLWAKDGEEALEMLDENHVDLILLDIMMPKWTDTNSPESCEKAEAVFQFLW